MTRILEPLPHTLSSEGMLVGQAPHRDEGTL